MYRGIPLLVGVPSRSVYCHAELRHVADLAAEAACWRWLAGWLLAACLAHLATLLVVAWVLGACAGCCGGCAVGRRPRRVEPLLEPLMAPLPASAVRSLTRQGHGVRVGAEWPVLRQVRGLSDLARALGSGAGARDDLNDCDSGF